MASSCPSGEMVENTRTVVDLKEKISSEPDFINSKKHRYSLQKFLKQNPEGTTDHIIAIFLCITPDGVRALYASAVEKIRQKMKVVVG